MAALALKATIYLSSGTMETIAVVFVGGDVALGVLGAGVTGRGVVIFGVGVAIWGNGCEELGEGGVAMPLPWQRGQTLSKGVIA